MSKKGLPRLGSVSDTFLKKCAPLEEECEVTAMRPSLVKSLPSRKVLKESDAQKPSQVKRSGGAVVVQKRRRA